MHTTLISSLYSDTPAQGASLTVSGWIRTLRDSKAFAFIELNDGSHFKNLQIVCDESLPNFKEAVKLSGSAITVQGTLVLTPGINSPRAQGRGAACGWLCEADFPAKKRHPDTAHHRPPAPPHQRLYAVFRIRSLAAQAVHRYFHERGLYVQPPSSPPAMPRARARCSNNHAEHGQAARDPSAPCVQEDFFATPADGIEPNQRGGFCSFPQRTPGPTFRAENSSTFRHAAGSR